MRDPVKFSGFTGAVGGLFLPQLLINDFFFVDREAVGVFFLKCKLLELILGEED